MSSHRLQVVMLLGLCGLAACAVGSTSGRWLPPAVPSAPSLNPYPIALSSPAASSSAPTQTAEASCYPIPGQPTPPGCPEFGINHEETEVDEALAIDDGAEPEEDEETLPPIGTHPLVGLSDAELNKKLRSSPSELGPMSIGFPGQGRLYNGVQVPSSERWQVVDPAHAWGTQETIDYLTKAVQRVNSLFPDCPRLVVGHVSAKQGGYLSPHKSHQAGRDVDIGYYHTSELRWFARATADNLDRPRTWALVKSLLKETRIDLILIDRSLQRLLREHASSIGEDEAWLKEVFEGGSGKRALVLHARGHADHIHVRFFNPIAQESGRRAGPTLLALGLLRTPQKPRPTPTATTYILHRVARNETLAMIAKKHGVTVQQIRAANNMLTNRIKPKQELKIPKQTPPPAAPAVAPAPGRETPRPKPNARPVPARTRS